MIPAFQARKTAFDSPEERSELVVYVVESPIVDREKRVQVPTSSLDQNRSKKLLQVGEPYTQLLAPLVWS